MTDPAARWQRVRALFEQALSLPTAERAAMLRERCPADGALRGEVEALLTAHRRAEGQRFLDQSPASPIPLHLSADEQEAVGGRVGAYRILRPLGNGGMGAVYLAVRDDDSYQQRVALKVVRQGGAPDPTLLSRFRGERQILAVLEHPNIARLLDGGSTSEGLPYLVMEYVEGLPIDEYCQRHDLSVADRLRLFGVVCAAVHYAHQNLVVHRDLKPRNILVTAKGVPKLLDFGIAKLLNPSMMVLPEVTDPSARPCTPEYASPEQLHGEPISTASDIYALGVLLYRLLTDARPQPHLPRPSDVAPGPRRRLLRGDLDTIVRMAARKEPQRRYPSAEQLKEDIDRHLSGLPVRARPDSLGYRSFKFLGRNRLAVTAAALGLLVLLGAMVTSAWHALERREEARLLTRKHQEALRHGQALQQQLSALQQQLSALQQQRAASPQCPPTPPTPAPRPAAAKPTARRAPPPGYAALAPLPVPMNAPLNEPQPPLQVEQPRPWMRQPIPVQQRPFLPGGARTNAAFGYKPPLVNYPRFQHDIRSYAPTGEGPLPAPPGDRSDQRERSEPPP